MCHACRRSFVTPVSDWSERSLIMRWFALWLLSLGVAEVERATARAVRERLLLPEDAERAIAAARSGRLAQLDTVRR